MSSCPAQVGSQGRDGLPKHLLLETSFWLSSVLVGAPLKTYSLQQNWFLSGTLAGLWVPFLGGEAKGGSCDESSSQGRACLGAEGAHWLLLRMYNPQHC